MQDDTSYNIIYLLLTEFEGRTGFVLFPPLRSSFLEDFWSFIIIQVVRRCKVRSYSFVSVFEEVEPVYGSFDISWELVETKKI